MNLQQVEEDFVTYRIYPTVPMDLVELRTKCLEVIGKYVQDYMWHQDTFALNVQEKYLSAKVTIGDNVEDEWYIISLLLKLTENLSVIAQVHDQDGEVLLIEAADHLPQWAQEPDLMENRVYLYQGSVHLIPIAKSPANLTPLPCGVPETETAINTVIKHCQVTLASDPVQKCIKKRLKNYPQDWLPMMHYCHVQVPKNLAKCLQRPHLVSKAIRAFYFRDSDDIKSSRYLKNFNPKQGLVKVGLRSTKCLYAMLAKQSFQPDKKAMWPLLDRRHPDFKASDLGGKLTQGFEIVFTTSETPKDKLFQSFIQSLTNAGYFQGQLQGSQKYNELYAKAKLDFQNSKNFPDFQDPVEELKELLETNCDDKIETLEEVDDDSWLDVELETFDEMLKSHFNVQSESSRSHQEIPSEIKNFLKTMSDLKGVEQNKSKDKKDFMDFRPDDLEKAFNKVLNIQEESDEDEDEEDIDFDETDFEGEMRSYFGQMSEELKGSKVTEDENDWTKPLDIDSKMLANLMESYNSQGGMPGPASTILEPLGFDLRRDTK